MQSTIASPGTRQVYWDVARAALILLGIPFHSALAYRLHGYDVTALDKSQALTVLSMAIHTFRMPAFFVIAGFFSGMILSRRDPRVWMKNRLARLGIPLLTGLFIVNIVQMAIMPFGTEGAWPASLAAATDEFLLLLRTPGFHWLSHMWFLVVLLEYSAVIALLHLVAPSLRDWRIGEERPSLFLRHPTIFLFAVMGATAVFCVGARLATSSLGLYENPVFTLLGLYNMLQNLPFFVIGVVLSREEGFLTYFTQPRWPLWIAALAAVGMIVAVQVLQGASAAGKIAATGGTAFSGLLMAHVVLSGSRRWLSKPRALISTFVAGAMVIYIVHHPILLVLTILFFSVALPPEIEFAIIALLTIGLSFACYLLVSRSRLLNLLLNGVMPEPRRAPALAQA